MTSPPPLDPYSPTPYAQQRAAGAPHSELPQPAPALLPVALVSGLTVASPIGVTWFLLGAAGIDEDLLTPVLAVTVVVATIGPLLGIIIGSRAARSCRGPARKGGWMLAIGCALQLVMLLMIMLASVVSIPYPVAIPLFVLGGLPFLTTLVAGVLGLRRPRQ